MVQAPAHLINLEHATPDDGDEQRIWGSARQAVVLNNIGAASSSARGSTYFVMAVGWPCVAMYAVCNQDGDNTGWRQFINVRGLDSAKLLASSTIPGIPTGIFWDRFLIDAAIFSLGSWLILFAPGTLRLIHRTRHGLCLHCAYDLKNLAVGSKCPECGRL